VMLSAAVAAVAPALPTAQPFIDWAWIERNRDYVVEQFVEHLVLTAIPMVLGFVIASLLAIVAVRYPRSYSPLLSITGLMFTIPSLALFVLLLPFTGLTIWVAVIPLTIYTLLILLRNIVEGFRGVAPEVRDSATAMGFRRPRQILQVELPLALPVIFAGLRIATVTTIGLVTVSALVGQGGLGQLFLDGFYRTFPTPLLVGLTLAIALALTADLLLLGLQRLLTPWTRVDA
jgi:osmoprotectant transport system permease protein